MSNNDFLLIVYSIHEFGRKLRVDISIAKISAQHYFYLYLWCLQITQYTILFLSTATAAGGILFSIATQYPHGNGQVSVGMVTDIF